jgi:hypothetical protein
VATQGRKYRLDAPCALLASISLERDLLLGGLAGARDGHAPGSSTASRPCHP